METNLEDALEETRTDSAVATFDLARFILEFADLAVFALAQTLRGTVGTGQATQTAGRTRIVREATGVAVFALGLVAVILWR